MDNYTANKRATRHLSFEHAAAQPTKNRTPTVARTTLTPEMLLDVCTHRACVADTGDTSELANLVNTWTETLPGPTDTPYRTHPLTRNLHIDTITRLTKAYRLPFTAPARTSDCDLIARAHTEVAHQVDLWVARNPTAVHLVCMPWWELFTGADRPLAHALHRPDLTAHVTVTLNKPGTRDPLQVQSGGLLFAPGRPPLIHVCRADELRANAVTVSLLAGITPDHPTAQLTLGQAYTLARHVASSHGTVTVTPDSSVATIIWGQVAAQPLLYNQWTREQAEQLVAVAEAVAA